jgi:hypothetical protein
MVKFFFTPQPVSIKPTVIIQNSFYQEETMKINPALRILIPLLILFALITTIAGLFWQGGPGPFTFTSLHGKDVQMYGFGIYQFDTHFRAPIARGTDAITLFVAIPLLIAAYYLYQKGSLRGNFFLVGVLAFLLYNSASMALGVAYNQLFLVYILYFSTSFFSFILAFFSVNFENLAKHITPKYPHRGVAIFLFFAGLSVFVWLSEILTPLFQGVYPPGLDSYTTEITYVIDLGIIPPVCYLSGFMVLRRIPQGYVLAALMIILNAFVGLVVISQTIFQYLANIVLTTGQYIGFVGIFAIMGAVAFRMIYLMLHNISQEALPIS